MALLKSHVLVFVRGHKTSKNVNGFFQKKEKVARVAQALVRPCTYSRLINRLFSRHARACARF
jgi:hypothetical protein